MNSAKRGGAYGFKLGALDRVTNFFPISLFSLTEGFKIFFLSFPAI